jgi:hypothetical protein
MSNFTVNSTHLYMIVAIVILFILTHSVFFLVRAWRRGLQLGMERKMLRDISMSSAIFSIAPAVAILLGAITLSNALGVPLPWIRMVSYGAIHYELPAASMAAGAAGVTLAETITDARVFSTIAWVMTFGIMPAMIIIPLSLKKIQKGVVNIGAKDKRWGELFMSALFLGLVSAFLGMIFSNVRLGLVGLIPVFVLFSSAIIMAVLGTIHKKMKVAWLENYALPISMLSSMGLAIPITNLIGG